VTQDEDGEERPLLAEETLTAGFEGSPEKPTWIASDAAERLLDARPSGNVVTELAQERLAGVLENFDTLSGKLEEIARERAAALLDAHRRVRKASRQRVRALRVEPHLPPDVLGVFVYLPRPGGSG
jgi:hypothetical protein